MRGDWRVIVRCACAQKARACPPQKLGQPLRLSMVDIDPSQVGSILDGHERPLRNARRSQDGFARGDQEGLSEARQKTPSGPQSRRQERRGTVQGCFQRERLSCRSGEAPSLRRRRNRRHGRGATPAPILPGLRRRVRPVQISGGLCRLSGRRHFRRAPETSRAGSAARARRGCALSARGRLSRRRQWRTKGNRPSAGRRAERHDSGWNRGRARFCVCGAKARPRPEKEKAAMR